MADNKEDYDHFCKVILCGSSCTGKTHLLLRYLKGELPRNPQSTRGAEHATKVIPLAGSIGTVNAQIWDTSGRQRYLTVTAALFRGSLGAMVVYDVTKRHTFDECPMWVARIRQKCANDDTDVAVMLVGNKIDLLEQDPSKREVSCEEAEQVARELGVSHIETSAVNSTNVATMFESILQEAYYHNLKVVVTLEKKTIDAAVLSDGDSLTLCATNMAGETLSTWTFSHQNDSVDTVWEVLEQHTGKSRKRLQIVQADGTLLENDDALADFLVF